MSIGGNGKSQLEIAFASQKVAVKTPDQDHKGNDAAGCQACEEEHGKDDLCDVHKHR